MRARLAALTSVAVLSSALAVRLLSASTPDLMAPTAAVAAIDRRMAEEDAEDQFTRADLTRTGERVAMVHARVVAHGRSFYKLTRAGLLPAGGGFEALVSHAMLVERAHRRLAGDLAEEKKLHGRAEDLEQTLERLSRDRADLATQRHLMDEARMASEDEARRQSAFARAFQTSTGVGSDYVAVYGGMPGASSGFGAARGRLLFPVTGRADVRPARREGTDGPGLEILAPAGSTVRATFAGRVAFADRYGPYGRIVIVDHGDHYFTVSGNLDAVEVKTGQDVGAGDRIGTVGDDGAGPMLYFEVRQGARTVNPGPWLGL